MNIDFNFLIFVFIILILIFLINKRSNNFDYQRKKDIRKLTKQCAR